MITKYNAIIVDSNLNSRARLYQAAHHMHGFGKVCTANFLQEAYERLEKGQQWDVIFISHRFNREEAKEFIAKAKETRIGESCAYILVLKAHQDTATMAETMAEIGDGYLFEPYSVDSLHVITDIASKVKAESAQKRLDAATAMMVGKVMDEIDKRALDKAVGNRSNPFSNALRKTQQMIKKLMTGKDDKYLDIAMTMLENAEPRHIAKTGYAGPSNRVKSLLDKKIDSTIEG